MRSHFELFPNTWNNREDFPLELDIKYALLEIQSHVYANDHIHPIFYTLCDTINKHEKSIVKKSLSYFEQNPEHLFKDVVNLFVFEKMIPNIIAYILFCQRNLGMTGLTNPAGLNYTINPREAIYNLWMEELPNNIWLPFYENHPVHRKYYEVFDEKVHL